MKTFGEFFYEVVAAARQAHNSFGLLHLRKFAVEQGLEFENLKQQPLTRENFYELGEKVRETMREQIGRDTLGTFAYHHYVGHALLKDIEYRGEKLGFLLSARPIDDFLSNTEAMVNCTS